MAGRLGSVVLGCRLFLVSVGFLLGSKDHGDFELLIVTCRANNKQMSLFVSFFPFHPGHAAI